MTNNAKTTIPSWLKTWGEMQREARYAHFGTAYARTLTTEHLKVLWDRYDGDDGSIIDDQISGEAIHHVLNERGEGSYCAV